MKKRIISCLMIVCLMLTMLPTSAFATGENGITASAAKVKAGETFIVTLKIPNISDALSNIEFNISFDKTVFEVIEYEKPSFATMSNTPSEANAAGRLTCTNTSSSGENDITALQSGGVMSATFKVKDGATNGTYKFDVSKYEVKSIDEATYMPIDRAPAGTVKDVEVGIVSELTGSQSVYITAPVKNAVPQTEVTGTHFTGKIEWKPEVSGGKFAAGKTYEAKVTLTADEGYVFAANATGGIFGAILNEVSEDGKTLTFNVPFAKTDERELASIAVDALSIAVPKAAPNATVTSGPLTLTATGTYDDDTTDKVTAAWALVKNVEGVKLENGKLTVTNKVTADKVEVKATVDGKEGTGFITITKETPAPAAIVATAPDSTDIAVEPGTQKISNACTATVYDQYGEEMPGQNVTWVMSPESVTGVTNNNTGTITVASTAQTCTVKLYAEIGEIKSNEVTFNITRPDSVVTSVELTGDDPALTVPTVDAYNAEKSEVVEKTYTATVKDQFGESMNGKTVKWSVSGNSGVTINENTGNLTITNKATGDSVTITATCEGKSVSKTVNVTRNNAEVKFVQIFYGGNAVTGTVTEKIPNADATTSKLYTAKVYDQYGDVMTNEKATLALEANGTGITTRSEGDGLRLEISSQTAEGNAVLTVTSNSNPAVKQELTIQLTNKTAKTLEVTQADSVYGSTLAEPVYNKVDGMIEGTLKVTYTGTLTKGGNYAESTTPPTEAGDYTVTVSYETADDVYTGSMTFKVEPKQLTTAMIAGIDAQTYTGSAITPEPAVKDGETTLVKDTDFTYSYETNTNAGTGKVTVTGKGNYAGTASKTFTINKATLTVTGTAEANATYGKKVSEISITGLTVTLNGTPVPGTWSFSGDEVPNAGNTKAYTATFTPTDGKGDNYNALTQEITPTITKAAAQPLEDISVNQKYTVTTAQSKDIGRAGMPADAGTLTYAVGSATGTATVSDVSVDANGVVKYTINGDVGAKVTIPVTITSTNYADSTVNVVITLTERDVPEVKANDITVDYTGGAIPASMITGTATCDGQTVEGTWSFKDNDAKFTTVADSNDSVAVVFTPTDTVNYASVEATIKVTINKAKPTGTPGYTAITAEGKTLADAALTVGTITPDGTIKWVAEDGTDLADDTAVEANKSYNWVFTPNDTANYETLTGAIQLWHKSTGGRYYYSSSNSSGTATITAVLTAKDAKSATDYTSGIYGLTFRSTADFSGFKGVKVDGKTIGKDNYVAESNNGSIEVYLKAAYLKTLAVGRHTLTIMAADGNASIDFTIGGVNTAPKTFDAGIAVYVTMAVASVTGMAWMGKKRED